MKFQIVAEERLFLATVYTYYIADRAVSHEGCKIKGSVGSLFDLEAKHFDEPLTLKKSCKSLTKRL